MRVWQPGSHLMAQRSAEVSDWSWRRTRRRLGVLARLVAPYKVRAWLSVVSLLAATATALAPPWLAKYALDAVAPHHGKHLVAFHADLHRLWWIVGAFVTDGVATLVQNTLTLVGTAIILFILDWRLALATLAVVPLMSVGTIIFRIRSTRAYRAVRERLAHVTATLAEDIAGMRVVQAFTREQAHVARFRDVNDRYRAANQETVVISGVYFPFVDLLSSISLAIVLGFGGYLFFHAEVTIGTLLAFMLYVQNFFDPVQQLSQLYGTFLSATAALDTIMDVLEEEPEVRDKPAARDLPRIEGHVRFEGVRFRYGRGDEVLHGIDLDVPAGTTVALVGHTGAGKSTIAKLLARFYDTTE